MATEGEMANATPENIASIVTDNKEALAELELLKQDLSKRGIVSKEDLDNQTKQNIQAISGAEAATINALTPFQLAGLRGLERTQFLSGLLNEDERQQHLDTYGNIEASPLFNFRLEEREKQLDRRQKAVGRVFSGAGVEEFRSEVDRLTAEEAERQLQSAQGLSTLGLQAAGQKANLEAGVVRDIAGLQQQRGQGISGIQQRSSELIGAQRSSEATQRGQIRGLSAQLRGAVQAGLGEQISGTLLNVGQARQAIRSNAALNQANLRTGLGTGLANIRTGQEANQVSLAANQARQQAAYAASEASLRAQVQAAPWKGLAAGVGQAASVIPAIMGAGK